jgi:GNAT superfamily N-acetyltransferase
VARIRAVPVRWDRTIADLPAGIDGAIARGFDEPAANTLCALLIAVRGSHQGRGLSRIALEAMAALARRHGFGSLIAPVRPSWKERYPTVPIARYAAWRRGDSLLFDPWLRVYERLGAEVLRPEPHSLEITGTVVEWEAWTGLAFPRAGSTSSRVAWRCSRSIAKRTMAPTGSRMSGCATGCRGGRPRMGRGRGRSR